MKMVRCGVKQEKAAFMRLRSERAPARAAGTLDVLWGSHRRRRPTLVSALTTFGRVSMGFQLSACALWPPAMPSRGRRCLRKATTASSHHI